MEPSVNKAETSEFSDLVKNKVWPGITLSNAHETARLLGSKVTGSNARFLLWHPRIKKAAQVFIEIFIPVSELLFDKPDQHCNMRYFRFETDITGEFAAVVLENVPPGNKDQFGAFYQYALAFDDGSEETIRDPMAWSLPYGIYAPAELYDIEKVLETRKDAAFFKQLAKKAEKDEFNRAGPSANLLEIHTGTATAEGTLLSLAQRYKQIAGSIKRGVELTPYEQNLSGFDGVELMPVDPVIEHPENHTFWRPVQKSKQTGGEITLNLQKPSVTNWGYDSVIFGAAAVNPSILSTGRPHELLDLIETLHNFPSGPIKVVLDVVYGHADNQACNLLPEEFFAGPGIYGQNINFKNPLVRAMILEIQRRKMSWGFDGIRVDASQDFKYYDAKQGAFLYDDEFLIQMSAVEPEAAGITYKPWMIFEDGRPWPRDDWELASTCRAITEQQKHAFQWAPTIFGYNVPFKYTYWVSKWWRLNEQTRFGNKWITGYANHDTMRRGTQTNPKTINVNFNLGNSLKMVMENAYNNPSATLLMNTFLPGVPMDFLHALGNTPWSFIRNTDTKYAIKIAAEEAHFTDWQITDVEYRNTRFFKRLKAFGFENLADLRRFAKALLNLVYITEYNPGNIADLLNTVDPPFAATGWTQIKLNRYASAWMADLYEYCNAEMHTDLIDARKSSFNLKTREYRLQNKWLLSNFDNDDFLKYREPVDGAIIFYGFRRDRNSGKELIFIANMEGQQRQVLASDFDLPLKKRHGWKIAISTPSVRAKDIHQPIKLPVSQGILFEKIAEK